MEGGVGGGGFKLGGAVKNAPATETLSLKQKLLQMKNHTKNEQAVKACTEKRKKSVTLRSTKSGERHVQ